MPAVLERPHPRTDSVFARAIREAGIVGAGGAGFPTYVKYQKATPILVVNGAESEPGYYSDKLLFREHAREFAELFVFLEDIEAYERIIVGAEEVAKPYMEELERLAEDTEAFEVVYFPRIYKYGQERALVKLLLDREVPRKGIPPDVGATVNNNETLFNVYRAIIEGRPVTTKFLSVYGETPRHLCLEAPVGALAKDLVAHAGLPDPDLSLLLFDGGPVLCDEVEDWTRAPYGIRKTTNGLMVVAPERAKTRAKSYPREDGPPPPERIENVEELVQRVRLALGGRFGAPARPEVEPGDRVRAGDRVAAAVPDKLSVPVHASIPGRVAEVTSEHIEIVREG